MADNIDRDEVFMCMYDNLFDLRYCWRRVDELAEKMSVEDRYAKDIYKIQRMIDDLFDACLDLAGKTK